MLTFTGYTQGKGYRVLTEDQVKFFIKQDFKAEFLEKYTDSLIIFIEQNIAICDSIKSTMNKNLLEVEADRDLSEKKFLASEQKGMISEQQYQECSTDFNSYKKTTKLVGYGGLGLFVLLTIGLISK